MELEIARAIRDAKLVTAIDRSFKASDRACDDRRLYVAVVPDLFL